MKTIQRFIYLQRVTCVLILVALSACSQNPPAIPAAELQPGAIPVTSNTPEPAATNTPVPTATNTPEPTQIPGVEVVPVSMLSDGVPWLPIEKGKEPMTVYYGFNLEKPPFDNVLVRQAFAAAVDREQIAKEAAGFKFRNVTPATSLTPPQVLGRDLYGQVGIPFNPSMAKDLLKEAGYESGQGFPSVMLYVTTRGSDAPGAYYQMAKSIAGMWKEHLGIKVTIKTFKNFDEYNEIWATNPPDIYQLGWGADMNDPENFLKNLFYSSSGYNIGHFNSPVFDSIVDAAIGFTDPFQRQLLYIQAEQILTEDEAGVIPLFHTLFYLHP